MQVTNEANLSPEALSELESALPEHGTLMEVVAWGQRLSPPVFLQETIALDEYTHEVLLRWRDDLWLVYSSS